MKNRIGLFVALLLATVGVQAATFNLFQPAAGILKGNPSTYITTAATSADVIATWSGTCDATTWLRGDGACATPTGTTVGANPSASVGLSAVNGVATTFMRSDGAPALSQSITPTWSAQHTFSVAPILSTLTGPLKGNGASSVGLAASSDIYGLWSGTCNNTTFLRGDGTCAAGAGGSGANPTATIGLTAVNGVAASFIRSDGAPPLSQAITPVWTGRHTFTASIASPTIGTGGVLVGTDIASAGSVIWNNSAAAANNRLWRCGLGFDAASTLSCQTVDDGYTAGVSWLQVARSGNTISSVTFPNATTIFSNSGGPALEIQRSANPSFSIYESAATADNRRWQFLSSSEQLEFRLANDAASLATNWLTVDRTLNVADNINLKATTITADGGLQVGPTANNGSVVISNSTTSTGTEYLIFNGTAAGAHSNTYADFRRATVSFGQIRGDGTTISLNGTWAVNGSPIAPYTSGSYTGTITGCTTSPTVSITYTKVADVVTIKVPSFSCTSNATTMTITGAPASIRPATTSPTNTVISQATDNSVNSFYNTSGFMDTAGTFVFARGASGTTGWTNSGSKGIAGVSGFTWITTN